MRTLLADADSVKAIRANIARVARGADVDIGAMLRILDDAANRLRGKIRFGTEFDQAQARILLRELNGEIQRLRIELAAPTARVVRKSLDAGDADMLAQAVRHAPSVALRETQGLDIALVDFASQNSASLVQQITTKTLVDLDVVIRQAATGSSTAAELAEEIGTVLTREGRPTGRFGTIATQSERVMRTETMRLYNGASRARIEKIAAKSPDVGARKKWIATIDGRTRIAHRDLNGATILVSESFNFAAGSVWSKVSYEEAGRTGGTQGIRVAAPLDSTLPVGEVANCRCGIGAVFG